MILGIDLGQHLGWWKGAAVGPAHGGTIRLKSPTYGGKLRDIDEHMPRLLQGVTHVAIEQPFMGDSWFPNRSLVSMLGHVAYWCSISGLAMPQEIAVSTAKLTLAGHGRAEKWQMIEKAAQLGYEVDERGDPLDEHAVDALAIWWVAVFGAREPMVKARTRSSKGRVIKP